MNACPKCGSENLDVVGNLQRCRECENYFDPAPAPTIGTSIKLATRDEVETITRLARSFVLWAIILIFIGCLGTFALLWLLTGGDSGIPNLAMIGVLFCGSCFGLAFWLFLVGQIIHIRALLAKKEP
jgi:hypothetical protein